MSFHDVAAPAAGTRLHAPGLAVQRQCACGNHAAGGECESCQRQKLLQRSDRAQADPLARAAARPASQETGADLSGVARTSAPKRSAGPMIQRLGMDDTASIPEAAAPSPVAEAAPAAAPEATPSPAAEPAGPEEAAAAPEAAPAASTGTAGGSSLLAEDGTTDLSPGQQRKTEFLDQLQSTVCARADAVLAASGRSTRGCPYLDGWFGYYRGRSASEVESALRRYAPETRNARTAAEYIPLVTARVEAGVQRWAATGEVSGVPDGLPAGMAGLAGAGGALGAVGSAIGGMFFKAKEGGARASDDPAAVQQSLGGGQPLESGVRGRMEQAFGQSFAHVRTHTDANAGHVSAEQNARAFTVGSDVAFGSGEYRPGTMVGDALIAHELAHVVQQGGASPETQAKSVDAAHYNALERDADDAAVGAVTSLWSGVKGAGPALRSGLRLSRCKSDSGPATTAAPASGSAAAAALPKKTVTTNITKYKDATGNADTAITYANTRVYPQANIEVKKGKEVTIDEAKSKAIMGADLELHEYSDPAAPTDEEKALFKENVTAGAVTMHYVKRLDQGSLGEAQWPGTGTGLVGVAIGNNGVDNTFSHELGHVLLDSGGHNVPDDTYLMHATAADPTKLSPGEIATMRASPFAK